MDIFRMQCFISVARHLSMSKAAQEMFITQPSMSAQMSALENELGFALFIRSKKGLMLTDAGTYVAERFEQIIGQYENMKSDLKVMQNRSYGKVTLGFHGSSDWADLSGFLRKFHSEFPNIEVDLLFDTWVNLKDRVNSRNIDLAFIEASELISDSDIESRILLHDGFCVCMPKNHRLAGFERVNLCDLVDEKIIFPDFTISPTLMTSIVKEANKYNIVGEDRTQGNYYVSINILVNAGFGISVLPKCLCEANPEIVSVPLVVNTPVNIALAWHKANMNPAAKQFVDFACRYKWE